MCQTVLYLGGGRHSKCKEKPRFGIPSLFGKRGDILQEEAYIATEVFHNLPSCMENGGRNFR